MAHGPDHQRGDPNRRSCRVGSGKNRDADYAALSGAKAALKSSGKLNLVERIVVFKATATGKVPPACVTGSATGCEVITGVNFRTNWETSTYTVATDSKGCLVIATSKNWCPTDRVNIQASADYYGVWIKLRHKYEFRLLGTGTDVARTTVMRIEPESS